MEIQQEKDKDFQKIPHILIDKGIWAKMNRKDVKIYVTINRYADYKSRIARPTVKTIARLSGVHPNHIASTVEKLSMMGLLEVWESSGRFHFRNIYRIAKKEEIDPDIALRIIPQKTEQCRVIIRGADGRFIPKNTDKGVPQLTEEATPQSSELSIIPQNTDKKEKFRDNSNRDIKKER